MDFRWVDTDGPTLPPLVVIMEKRPGISGLTGAFRESVAQIAEGSKIVFTGSVAVCPPFAELLAYAVREKKFDLVYVPKADPRQARKIKWIEGVGYAVSEEGGDPRGASALIVLGGLAMPKFGCSIKEINAMISLLGEAQQPKVVGVCFMDIFQRSGWEGKVGFDTVINATMETEVKR